jgi:hypothetical protein
MVRRAAIVIYKWERIQKCFMATGSAPGEGGDDADDLVLAARQEEDVVLQRHLREAPRRAVRAVLEHSRDLASVSAYDRSTAREKKTFLSAREKPNINARSAHLSEASFGP